MPEPLAHLKAFARLTSLKFFLIIKAMNIYYDFLKYGKIEKTGEKITHNPSTQKE